MGNHEDDILGPHPLGQVHEIPGQRLRRRGMAFEGLEGIRLERRCNLQVGCAAAATREEWDTRN